MVLPSEGLLILNVQKQAVFDAALALPESEKAELVERLLESLSPKGDEVSADELAAELDRRLAEFERDPSVGIPWSEVQRHP